MKRHCLPALLLALVMALAASSLHAGPPISASYAIPAATLDSGGGKSSSTNYTNDGSAGGLAGISTVADPITTAKHGYIGQLYEITGLQLSAAPEEVPEGQSTQLAALAVADDDSFVALDAAEIGWSVVDGPLTSINEGGLATAGLVYQDTPATVEGIFAGFTETLDLLVLDTVPDNFGLYAGDGLPDDWQVGYFGEDNPRAAPGVDFTGNGQNNLFAYIADLDPTDHDSVFRVRIERDPVLDRMKIIFSPRKESRNYQVLENGGLGQLGWTALIAPLVTDSTDPADERTVTDTAGIEDRKFYRVEIALPK